MHVQVDGVSIHYTIEGDGPWLTMSHSLACNLHMWDEEARRLSRRYRVLRFDTRGHGRSDAPAGPYSLATLAGDVRALLAFLGVRGTHFVGLSMGGMIGLALALDAPELLRSLVLCDTGSRFSLDVEARARVVEAGGLEAMVAPTLERFLSASFRERNGETTEKIAAMIRATPVAGYLGCCRAISTMALTSRLGEIRCPTLVLVGENDVVTPPSMAREIQRGIDDAQLVVVPDAAHLANIEQPEVFNRALLGFVDQVSARSRPDA
ncbi:MAG: 3-oxoadipate enol-lactonase [Burkholderiaceae bacterium]|nr:3-oxoadipate enol-lactonase [Burkholderiaceae bacterium]